MNAAVITAPGQPPIYSDFDDPAAREGMSVLTVSASALTQLAKARASGAHYSSEGIFPSVPGVDGVGRTAEGRRVYFMLPETPFGAFAEKSLVRNDHIIPVPDTLDDVTAAALANPGMSAWASMVDRAHLQRGETVLIHGATGSAGRVAISLAKFLGAFRVLATGRNQAELEALRSLGADVLVPFTIGADHPNGAAEFEQALLREFTRGVDVVIDYLWGVGAKAIITAAVKGSPEGHPVRFVQVGTAAGQDTIDLSASALRSSGLILMGSGLKSVAFPKLLESIAHVFDCAPAARISMPTQAAPLAEVATAWQSNPKARIVLTMP